jgi:enoyl-[acyl-carrier protein] reductase I
VILEGRRLVITGVITTSSIAFGVARLAQEQGADIVLTSFGRAMSLTRTVARRLPDPPDVLELDVTDPGHFDALAAELGRRWGSVDGALHAVAYAPSACFDTVLDAPWSDVGQAMEVSAYSLKALAASLRPLMPAGGSIVGLDFDATVAWPNYGWMGVAKAALESTARYLARDLGPDGIRVNLVSAGPLVTLSARAVEGFSKVGDHWSEQAPLGWDHRDGEAVARGCVALLSDWFPATTGEVVHVDGGFHAVGCTSIPQEPT